MRGEIGDEMEEGVPVKIHSDDGAEHIVVIGTNGSIVAAKNDSGYPLSETDWTREQSETFTQARRYAQYYVAEETEYDTLPWRLDPDRIDRARRAVRELSGEETEQWFGTLRRQCLSHHDGADIGGESITRPYDLPADLFGGENTVLYEVELYLDDAGDITAVSDVIVSYYVAQGERTRHRYGDDETPDSDPDARVELPPAPFVEPEPLRDYLAYNLRCQVRDCHLMMGLEPPEAYCVLGQGQYRFTGKYHHFDVYPPYHDVDADIDGYTHEFAPEVPISTAELAGLFASDENESLYDQLKSTLFGR